MRIKHILVMFLVTFALAEGISRVLVRNQGGVDYLLGRKWRYVLPFRYDAPGFPPLASDSSGYRVYDSTLGWSHGAWRQDGIYLSDDKGYRCGSEAFMLRVAGPTHHDIVCIGNSFTHGDAVPYEDTWPYHLSKATGRSVLNMGVGGYGIDQAVLRFMQSDKTCDTVVLGLVPGDLERSLTTVYNYYIGGTKSKPKFRFSDTGYTLSNVPCLRPEEFVNRPLTQRAAAVYEGIDGYHDYVSKETKWWTRSMFLRLVFSSLEQARHKKPPVYMTAGDDLDYCIRIFGVFKRHCEKRGIVPMVLLIDNGNSLADRRDFKVNTWSLLQGRLDSLGIRSIQFQDSVHAAYVADPSNIIHPKELVHYSPAGHRLLAEMLAKAL